jgi:multiple sugar transport system permease protein
MQTPPKANAGRRPSGSAFRQILGRKDVLGYALVAPVLLIILVVLVGPLVYNAYLSLFDFNFVRPHRSQFVGLANYVEIFSQPAARRSLLLTVAFTAIVVSCQLVLGFVYALVLHVSFWGNHLVRTLILIPMMVSEVVGGLSWRLLFNADFGLLNYVVSLFGVQPQIWLGPRWAFFSVVVAEVWQYTPFVTLILLAGLQGLPKDVLEAAEVDGATPLQKLYFVTLPLLKPMILLALVFRTMFTLRVFTSVWVLTGGGPADRTLVVGIDIYRTAFRYYEFGQAASLSLILLALTMVFTLIYMRLLRREALA